MLSRRLPEVAQAAHPRENAPCARRSRSNAAGRARTRTTRYARGSPRTRARGTHPTRAHTRARPTRAHTRARPTLGARAHARLTRATRTHTRAHTHTRARATSVDPRLRPCGADINSESSSSPPPALLSPQARSSPPPALSPLPISSLVLLAEWTPERSLSTSTVRTELMQTTELMKTTERNHVCSTAAEPEEAAAGAVVDH